MGICNQKQNMIEQNPSSFYIVFTQDRSDYKINTTLIGLPPENINTHMVVGSS